MAPFISGLELDALLRLVGRHAVHHDEQGKPARGDPLHDVRNGRTFARADVHGALDLRTDQLDEVVEGTLIDRSDHGANRARDKGRGPGEEPRLERRDAGLL